MPKEEEKIKKIVPSPLEKGFYHILYHYVGEHIPERVTPNQITLMGAAAGLLGIGCALVSRWNRLFLVGTLLGILGHLVCDDLDGYVARKTHRTSLAGGYLDLLTDILHITYLIMALAFAQVVHFQIAIFMVPVYALILFTAMNSILYLKEFPFPRLGPIETHLFFAAVCLGTLIFGTDPLIRCGPLGFTFGDIAFIVGGIPMYFEMIRLQIQCGRRLKQKDHEK